MNHDGYAELWAAVFALALKDACETESLRKATKDSSAAPAGRDAIEAWRFLTDGGEWGAHRDWLAGLNGINPGIVREVAMRRGPSRATRVALMQAEELAHAPVVRREPAKPRKKRMAAPRSPERIALCAAVAADWGAGVPTEEIVKTHGVSPHMASKMARAAGIKRPPGFMSLCAAKGNLGRPKKVDRNAEILLRRADGESYAEIARAMGMPWSTVRAVVRKAGSAVDARGGSRAAGDGRGSFHGQTMPAGAGD